MDDALDHFEMAVLVNELFALEGFEGLGFKQIRVIIGLPIN